MSFLTKYLPISIAAFFFGNINAQSDAKATEILNKVSKIYKSYSTIKASFSVTTQSPNAKATTQTGTVWIKGSKYKLDFGGQETYCNGKFIWTFVKGGDEVTKENYKPKDNTITPNEIFTIYNKDFKNQYEGVIARNGKTYEVIKMVPKKKANYSYAKLEIDKTTNKIDRMIMVYKNGTTVTYSITSLTPNTTMADSTFEFDLKAHPGVTEVDLTKK